MTSNERLSLNQQPREVGRKTKRGPLCVCWGKKKKDFWASKQKKCNFHQELPWQIFKGRPRRKKKRKAVAEPGGEN